MQYRHIPRRKARARVSSFACAARSAMARLAPIHAHIVSVPCLCALKCNLRHQNAWLPSLNRLFANHFSNSFYFISFDSFHRDTLISCLRMLIGFNFDGYFSSAPSRPPVSYGALAQFCAIFLMPSLSRHPPSAAMSYQFDDSESVTF